MPRFLVRKVVEYTTLIEAMGPEEALQVAEQIPDRDWENLLSEDFELVNDE